MQIKIDFKILIFVLIFFLTNQLKLYIILMIFACLHEIGHIIIGMLLGFKLQLFEIKPIGFSVSFNNPIKDYNKRICKSSIVELKKIFIYVSGPILNFLFAIVFFYTNIEDNLKIQIIYINLILAIVNMIPIYPLDGGRIIKSMICIFGGLKKSYIYIEKISSVTLIVLLLCSSIAILYYKNWGLVVIIVCLVYIKIKESKIINQKIKLYNLIENNKK